MYFSLSNVASKKDRLARRLIPGIPKHKGWNEAGRLPLVPVYTSLGYINSELPGILAYRMRHYLKSTKNKYTN